MSKISIGKGNGNIVVGDSITGGTVVANVRSESVFDDIRAALRKVDANERQKLLAALGELESAPDRVQAASKLASFISLAANSMTVIQPFIPALTKLLH